MRKTFVLGFGLAGVLAAPATAQFASERPNTAPPAATPGAAIPGTPDTPPPLPPGVQPIGGRPVGGAYVPPVAGIGAPPGVGGAGLPAAGSLPPAPAAPRDLEIRSALGPNHPWAIKPEDGAFFLCVKSYSRPAEGWREPGDNGPSARAMAEALATEIRDLYRVQAFLYEYISDERKAEMAALAAARERARIFAGQLEKYRQEAKLKGMTFLEDEGVRVHYKTVRYNDQIAVLVGGFKSEKDARQALEKIRTEWLPPKNPQLMDTAQVSQPGPNGKRELVVGYLNPYLTATVVPNPMIARAVESGEKLDPFVKKLNEDNPYSLLNATKGWTLAVRSFTAPVEIRGQDGDNAGLMRKSSAKGAKVLEATAEQAEAMAKALRGLKRPLGDLVGLEVFVLHTRHGSIVTIGQFDGPTDPALVQTKQLLLSLPLKVTEDALGSRPVANTPTLFTNMVPIPIPKE
jgi:hypothetical protein